ncbi:MAG: rhomboid family intramembrane serine protease [Saprospiraceae bacterium]|nr:rhomboid family intramembrane serine protease [Saprospiraceae bacterium]
MQAHPDPPPAESELFGPHFRRSIRWPAFVVLIILLTHFHQVFFGWDPGAYGIMSRRMWGLRGILTGPMVHGSWEHLFSNIFPLFFLSALSLLFYRKVAMQAFWAIYLLTGLTVWLFARPVSHIGASGVVYGLVAFIFWNGIFRRSMRSIVLAVIVLLLYSGMFMGILPKQEGISWESHLFGGLVGILTAYWFKGVLEDEEAATAPYDPFAEERNAERQLFLPKDTFEKTKAQRQAEAEEAARLRAEQNRDLYPPFWRSDGTW